MGPGWSWGQARRVEAGLCPRLSAWGDSVRPGLFEMCCLLGGDTGFLSLTFFFISVCFFRAVLGSQQNRVESTESSHLPPAPTYGQHPPSSTSPPQGTFIAAPEPERDFHVKYPATPSTALRGSPAGLGRCPAGVGCTGAFSPTL